MPPSDVEDGLFFEVEGELMFNSSFAERKQCRCEKEQSRRFGRCDKLAPDFAARKLRSVHVDICADLAVH